jgi:hypothetical protein
VNQVGLTGNSRNVVIAGSERDDKAKAEARQRSTGSGRSFLRLLQQLRRRRFIYDQLIH